MNGKDAERWAANAWIVLAGRLAMVLTPVIVGIFGTVMVTYLSGLSSGLSEIKAELAMVKSDLRNADTIRRYSTAPRLESLESRVDTCCGERYSPRAGERNSGRPK